MVFGSRLPLARFNIHVVNIFLVNTCYLLFFFDRQLTGNNLRCTSCRNRWLQDLIRDGTMDENLECYTDTQEAIPLADVGELRNCCKLWNTVYFLVLHLSNYRFMRRHKILKCFL